MNRNQYLTEAIQVEGAEFIGNGKGYDVFDITSWTAAQRFQIENRQNDLAGDAYVHNEHTFNTNINQDLHLYFFAEENTNKVFGAVIKSNGTRGNIIFNNNADNNLQQNITANFMFENASDNSNACKKILPLYLIPGNSFDSIIDINGNECYHVSNHILDAAIGQLTQVNSVRQLELPEFITGIASNAFEFDLKVNSIILTENISELHSDSLNGVETIYVPFLDASEAPATWEENWNSNKTVVYGWGLSDSEIEAINKEKAERIRIERERQAEAEARKTADERKLEKKIRYVVEGNQVAITGTRPGVTILEIPERIEDKSVTKIKAYAFAYSDLVRITLPHTIKVIEQGAFAFSNLRGWIYVPKDCIVGKNALLGTSATIERE